jgi:hypothetical protein
MTKTKVKLSVHQTLSVKMTESKCNEPMIK